MSLTRVTITGADDNTWQGALRDLSAQYPFVEWGILRSTSREGTPRYPREDWRRGLERVARDSEMHLSAHFCGQLTRDTLAGDYKWVRTVGAEYDRVQFNGFCTNRVVEENVGHFGVEWILQCRNEEMIAEAGALATALPSNRISALWDCSGGRGLEPFSWPRAPLGLSLGYAGGIGPGNVLDVLNAIGPVSHDFWIDMESGVRTDDYLDLDKVRVVLHDVAPFVQVSGSAVQP